MDREEKKIVQQTAAVLAELRVQTTGQASADEIRQRVYKQHQSPITISTAIGTATVTHQTMVQL